MKRTKLIELFLPKSLFAWEADKGTIDVRANSFDVPPQTPDPVQEAAVAASIAAREAERQTLSEQGYSDREISDFQRINNLRRDLREEPHESMEAFLRHRAEVRAANQRTKRKAAPGSNLN